MSTYCMSDIHGEIDRYKAMLDLIDFKENDSLYVIGDVIDRSPGGIAILQDIMARPNVYMILGNHERMCWETLGPENVFEAKLLWRANGGGETWRELLYIRTPEERKAILEFIEKLPDSLDIEVNGQIFHLVHGYPADNRYDRIWGRPAYNVMPPCPGKTVIIGHTPTVYLNNNDGEPFKLWHGNGVIGIDCGCGKNNEFRRLACLRLDDMKEFYI